LKYHLKIFGTGLLVRVVKLKEEQCNEIKSLCSSMNIECSQLIYDVDLINKIGFSSWSELPFYTQEIWADISKKNSLEVSCLGKRVLKTTCWDIIDPSYLFPLYRVNSDKFFEALPRNVLVFGEVVTGQIFRCSFDTESFFADQLCFSIVQPFQNFDNLNISNISYVGKLLKSKSNQFITRSFFAFVR
jgi:hypothetical protein